MCKSAHAKLIGGKVKMEALLCQPEVCIGIPAEYIANARAAYGRMKTMIAECAKVMASPTDLHDLSFSSMKEVVKIMTDAKNAEHLITSITKVKSRIAATS